MLADKVHAEQKLSALGLKNQQSTWYVLQSAIDTTLRSELTYSTSCAVLTLHY
jgi:hypothetical protein